MEEEQGQPSSHLGAAWVAGPVRLIVVLDLLDGAKRAGVLWSCGPNEFLLGRESSSRKSITRMPKPFPGKKLQRG